MSNLCSRFLFLFLLSSSVLSYSDDKPLLVGSEQNYPPFALGLTDETADGFTVELWRAVAAESHLNSTIRVLPFHEVLKEFKAGNIDVLINLAQSNERHQFADFTVPHVIVNGAIFVRKGESHIHSEADLNNKHIIVLNGDLAHDYARSKGWGQQLLLVNTAEAGFQLLASGQYDALLLSKLTGQQTLATLNIHNIQALPIKVGFAQKFSFAVQKGNTELLAKINEGLALTKANGIYDALYEKWFGIYEEKAVLSLLIKYLTPIIGFFLLIVGINFYRHNVERKYAMQVLRKSEAHYRNTFELAPIGVVNISLDGRFLAVNQTYCNLLGYSREELLTMTVMDITQEQDNIIQSQLIQQSLAGEITTFCLENRYVRKDGSLIWGGISVQLNYRTDGKPDYFIATVENITERKQQQNEILITKNELQATLNAIPDLLFELDLAGRYHNFHAPRTELLAASPEQFLGKTITEILPPEAAMVCLSALQEALQQGWSIGKQIKLELQETHWFELSVAVKKMDNEQQPHFIVLSRDITDRKRAETELFTSEQKFRLLIERVPLALGLASYTGKLLYTNDRFIRTFGYTLDDIPTLEHWYLHAYPNENYRQQAISTWSMSIEQAAKQGTDIEPAEYHITCKNGEMRVMLISGIFFENNLLATFMDITERKHAEQQLRNSEVFTNSILNSLTSHIAVLDAQGVIIAVNNAWQQFAETNGLSDINNSMIGINYLEACVKSMDQPNCEDSIVVVRGIEAVLVGESDSFHLEYPCHSPTQQRWFYMHVSPLQGEQKGVVISHENITQRKEMEVVLKASEARLRTIIEISPIPMALNDNQQNITFLNPAFIQTFGYNITDIPTLMDWWSNAYPDPVYRQWVADRWQEKLNQVEQEHNEFVPLELVIHCKNGTKKTVLASASAINSSFHDIHLVVLYDITERKQAEVELRIAATVFESQEGMFITDAKGSILRVNHAFTKITGYSETDVIGKNPRLLNSGQQDKTFFVKLWQQVYDAGAWQGEIWNRRKNGEVYPEWLTITAVKTGDDNIITNYVATLTDITERKITEKRIHQLAFYDPLTQLPNRRLLYEHLKHGIELSHRTGNLMAVLMLDLDKFKAVNDHLGHAAGDELLQYAAERVKGCLREMDTVARLGGDEFVILITNVEHYEIVARIADTIIHTLTQPFILTDNKSASIGASIGIAIYPHHGDDVETLIDNADAALYCAKDAGRGCFAYFSEELTQKARERIILESRLRTAIEQQALYIYFQPQIDIASGQIVAAEVLVRWDDGIHGLIMPSDFIALAEETGLIIPLGEWVLRETCRFGKQWLDQGLPPINLAVNVSPYQFRRCDINALVTQILNESGFPATSLELEITESGLMENQQQAMTILNNLHEQGVHLAIDDFGTGYSSLSHLKFFPIDVLKIDKSFIDDIPFLSSDMAITSTIIVMAHHLGFKVLAEGVETQEQLAFLQQQGCDSYQGYLYSKPLSAHDFTALLLNQKIH